MASLSKTYDSQKRFGQVYTPRFVVEKILASLHFDSPKILGKSVLDPACGDGRFLTVVAQKIIQLSPKQKLKENLEQIYGWDIDSEAVSECIKNLNDLIKNAGITVNWKVEVCNSLLKINDLQTKFDFIVGNPPYIRIQHLEEQERKFVQSHYQFCKSGSTDSYIAFYELCLYLLSENGVCGLITPNTFFYSETAKALRNYFTKHQNIISLTNYADIQLFDNATTYSAIAIFGKESRESFVFEQAQTTSEFLQRMVNFSEIKQEKIWRLTAENNLSSDEIHQKIKLKEICNIHVGVTTLCDKAYIFQVQPIENEQDYFLANTKLKGQVKIEKAILKPIVKASKLKNGSETITEYILFPYRKNEQGKNQIIPEQYLKTEFPFAYQYLLSVKEELDKRDNGKPNAVTWYAFGRSQGLDTSFGKKILFSPMNQKPNFILYEAEESTFYSGYCIKYEGDYQWLLSELNSERLAKFISVSSRDFRGGWKAYNKRALEEFEVSNLMRN